MKKRITQNDFDALNNALSDVYDMKHIMNDVELNIIDGNANTTNTSDIIFAEQIELEFGKSNLATSIKIDTTGRVYLNGDNDRVSSPFIDELVTISQVGMRLNQWFRALPTMVYK